MAEKSIDTQKPKAAQKQSSEIQSTSVGKATTKSRVRQYLETRTREKSTQTIKSKLQRTLEVNTLRSKRVVYETARAISFLGGFAVTANGVALLATTSLVVTPLAAIAGGIIAMTVVSSWLDKRAKNVDKRIKELIPGERRWMDSWGNLADRLKETLGIKPKDKGESKA